MDLFNYDTYSNVRRYKKEVLMIHGDRDGVVPLPHSQRALKEYPSATLHTIENARHGFSGNNMQKAAQYLWNYLVLNDEHP